MAARRYEQRLRAEAAEETRKRILDALYERLGEAPAEPVSVEEVARRAGVARSTVYLVFGSRAGLFDALTDSLLSGGGHERIVAAVGDPDARENVRGGLEGGVQMFVAHRDVLRVLWSMAQLDPDGVGGAVERAERRRSDGMAYVAERLAEQGILRPEVTVEDAAHTIWVLASFDAFDLLYTGRGLPADEVVRLLVETVERALFR